MTEHALDAMIYAWRVMKEKEENKMEGIYVGKIKSSVINEDNVNLLFIDHGQDISVLSGSIEYDNTPYCLVRANDILINNDKILKLRYEVKRLTDECNDWKARYAKANNELFQKGLAYGTLETEYKNEKIAGEILLKDRDALKEKVDTLEAELDSMRAENKRLRQLMATSMSNLFEGSGITMNLTQPNGPESLALKFDIPELNEAKKKVEDLEKKLADSKSNETFWRGRKEEEEDYHHYWLHTFDRAVKQAAEKGIHIGVCGNDEDCNAGIVTLDNMKAEELEKRVVQMEDANQKFNQQVLQIEADYQKLNQKYGAADNALEYWNNTYNDIVIAGKKVGVKIEIEGRNSDRNAGNVCVTNEKTIELMVKLNDTKQKQDKKWQAMLDALKTKGVEVIYMGEEDGKPIIDVKVPAIDILRTDYIVRGQAIDDLKREIENLKSKKVAEVRYEFEANSFTIVCTMCDGSKQTTGMDLSWPIDATSISCGTVPKCSSCAHYVSGSRSRDVWCHKPVSKEGPGTIRRLSTEEAEGPACVDFKARKE